jgi:4-hydroxyphenylpyruvate dioxygenase
MGRDERLLKATQSISDNAASLRLHLIALNPFGFFNGLTDPIEIAERLREAEIWCQLCNIMHMPILQVRFQKKDVE